MERCRFSAVAVRGAMAKAKSAAPQFPEVGQLFRALREAISTADGRQLTQDEIAERAGIPRTQVNKVEGGYNKLTSSDMLKALSVALDLSRDDFESYIRKRIALPEVLARRGVKRAPVELPEDLVKYVRSWSERQWPLRVQEAAAAAARALDFKGGLPVGEEWLVFLEAAEVLMHKTESARSYKLIVGDAVTRSQEAFAASVEAKPTKKKPR